MDTDILARPVRVLHLEDNENDHLLVAEMLQADGLNCQFTLARSKEEFSMALGKAGFDLIISDFSLPSYDGLSALSVAREYHADTPFIFFSGTIGEDVAVESLKNGAVDYVLKQRPTRLIAAVRRALRNAAEHEKLKRAESALRESEERFRVVARATDDVVWEWDVQKGRVALSANFKTAFGDNLDLSADDWFDLIHADDRLRVVTGVSSLLATGGSVWWSEHRLRREDGSYAFVFDRASVIYSAGRPQRMIGVTIDMSRSKAADEKIHEQAALLDKARDAIIVSSVDHKITYWNQGATRIYGWTEKEALGRNVLELFFHEAAPAQFAAQIKALEATGEWIGELREFTKSGEQVIVQVRATLIRDEQGRPKSILRIKTDITEQKKLEEQFLRSQRLESLGALVSGIAHDLNNTLVPIIIGVDILKDEPISEDAASMVRTMESSARRSAEMVKQMLLFARGGESSKMSVRPDVIVKEMGKIIADTFPKSVNCRVRVEKNLHPILAVPTQIHQVLMNLCVNARDAMNERGTLVLAAENAQVTEHEAAMMPGAVPGEYVCISVADTGSGIAPEQLEKIFLPFYTTKAPGKGTGLGLSTCQTIVRNHGGFLAVQSQVGSGTEFKVFLPAADVKPAETAGPGKSLLPAGKGERILVVDDEAAILAMTRAALENFGYQVTTAVTGMEAIARLRDNPDDIHLVITDYAMPLMDGEATIGQLRKIRPDLKILVASGSEEQLQKLSKNVPINGFVPKPFTTEGLLAAVHAAFAPR
jgi:PAS domain S-box-containing protein